MIIIRENETRFAHSTTLNNARVISALSSIVENHKGRVKPLIPVTLYDTNDVTRTHPYMVTHTTYISFILNEHYYYFQIDTNPFFPFYYVKTPIIKQKRSLDACLEELSKDWLYDCNWSSDCPAEIINMEAEILFKQLMNAPVCVKRPDYKEIMVPNTYSSGSHVERIPNERWTTIDF